MPCGAFPALLLALALLKQEVIALDHNFVARLKTVENFDAVVALYPYRHDVLLVTLVGLNEDDLFSAVVEHGGLRERDGGAANVRDDLDVGEHVGLEPVVGVRDFRANLHGSRVRVNDAGNENDSARESLAGVGRDCDLDLLAAPD